MTDSRYYKDTATDTLLGDQQKDWLIQGLKDSESLVKVVVLAGRVLRTTDSGAAAPRGGEGFVTQGVEYDDLMAAVNSTEVTGKVLFLSGDIHYNDCYSLEEEKDLLNNKVLEVTSSPLRVNSKHKVNVYTGIDPAIVEWEWGILCLARNQS